MKEGYKETKIGIIPNDWICQDLGNIIKLGNGKDYKHLKKGDIPVYGTGGIITYVDDFLYEGKTIGIGRKGSIDKPVLLKGKFWTVDTLFYIKEFINSDVDFVYNLFLKIPWLLYNEATGLPSLSQQIIKKIKVPLPPLKEQKAIADCLSTWDKAIELQRELILSKEVRKKSLAQQLLTGKRRLPGFTNEWKEEPYGKLLSQVKRKENWEDNHLYHLISVRRRSGGIFNRDSLYGHQIAVKELMKVKKGDFLISKMQILHGASSIVKQEFENFYVSGSYIILNVRDPKKLSPDYLDFYSKQKIFYHQTYISSYGVHIEKMTFDFKTFLKMNMMVPSIDEQNAVVKVLETADKELQLEKQKLADLQQQKKALMQQLLTGKVRLV